MRRTLSLKRIVPTHESFFLSNHDKVDCSCRCKISISSSNSLRVSNDGSQIHQLSLIRSESKSLCWKVRHVGSSKHEFDIDGVYDGTNEDEVIHLTIYPEDGCCDDHASAVLPSLPSLHEEKVEWVDLRSNGVVMAKVYLSIDIKDDYYTHNNFTGNVESDLHLTIRLNQVHFHETQSVCGPFFITYEFAGATIKSNECHLNSKEFEPLEDEFHVSINHDEIQSFLEQNKIKMYVYNYGRIFGEVQFDLYSALILDNVDKPCGQFKPDERWKRWIELFSPAVREPSIPRSTNPVMKIQVELIISEGNPPGNDKGDQDKKEIFVTQENCSNISDVDFLTKNRSSFSSKSILEQSLMEKANSLARAELELDKRRQKWDEFRIREERKFQDYLMKKEEALRSLLQDQMKEQEIDHMRTIETCRSEYKRLEARLKSALSEVETKEREMDRILAANNTTFIQKVTELELKDKLIQDEAKHTVDMEKAKLEAMTERIKGYEKAVEENRQRALIAESEAEQLRNKFKSSNEAKVTQELQMLRERMDDIKIQLEREKKEKDQLLSQKDQYQQAAHNLTNVSRKGRGKRKSSGNSNGKQKQELHRIQNELEALTNKTDEYVE